MGGVGEGAGAGAGAGDGTSRARTRILSSPRSIFSSVSVTYLPAGRRPVSIRARALALAEEGCGRVVAVVVVVVAAAAAAAAVVVGRIWTAAGGGTGIDAGEARNPKQ